MKMSFRGLSKRAQRVVRSLNKNNVALLSGFRRSHIAQALEQYDSAHLDPGFNAPLDLYLRQYYIRNPSIGQKDRASISAHIYELMRHRGYLDLLVKERSWAARLEALLS